MKQCDRRFHREKMDKDGNDLNCSVKYVVSLPVGIPRESILNRRFLHYGCASGRNDEVVVV